MRPAADAMMALGLASAPVTALAGASDWVHGSGAIRRTGLWHATLNAAATSAYALSMVCRLAGRRGGARLLAVAGAAFASLAAYHGGRMAFEAPEEDWEAAAGDLHAPPQEPDPAVAFGAPEFRTATG